MMQPTQTQDDQVALITPPPGRRTRVILALLAGVILLGGAAAVAVWALSGGGGGTDAQVQAVANDPASPGDSPTSTAATDSPSPTAEVLGRNVFAPLIDTAAAAGVPGDGAMPGAVDVTAAGPTIAPNPGQNPGLAPVTAPGPPVTVTRTQVGPTVTGPTQTVPGPTTTVAGPTVTTGFPQVVKVVGVIDPVVDNSNAIFDVNGASSTVAPAADFGGIFTYLGYDAATGLVAFRYVSTVVQVKVGQTLGLQ